jgi:hypothetical protein
MGDRIQHTAGSTIALMRCEPVPAVGSCKLLANLLLLLLLLLLLRHRCAVQLEGDACSV